MRNKTMLFGPIGAQVEIPCPESGMNFVGNLDSEETRLNSGGLAVYRAPTTYKTYSMTWKDNAEKLQPIVDMHAGAYGPGPFYMTDPLAVGENLLPTRWASSWQLAHVAGSWGNPTVNAQTSTPEGKQANFNPDSASTGPSIVVPVIPGKPMYFKAWGDAFEGNGVRVSRRRVSTGLWSQVSDYEPGLNPYPYLNVLTEADAAMGLYDAVKLTLFGAPRVVTALQLRHMELSTTMSDKFRMGRGVGALQFTGNSAGTINSAVFDRIGMTIDLKEVQRDPNN